MKRFTNSIVLVVMFLSMAMAFSAPRAVSAAPAKQQSNWCGNGSEADNYGFTYDFSQPHWTIGNGLISEQAMIEVDVILDKLNADELAQTMILVLPADQVGIPVNCAVHFLRYMRLGLVDGPHADNGFTFLFIVGNDGTIDVHYGAGLGLPSLTAQNLTPLNRLAEDTYAQTGSLDTAIVETIKAYDAYVRSEYQLTAPTAVPAANNPPPQNTPSGSTSNLPLLLIVLIVLGVLLVGGGIMLFNGGSSTDDDGSTETYHDTSYPSFSSVDSSPHTTPRYESHESSYTPPSHTYTPPSRPSYTPPSRPSYSPPSRPSSPPSRGGSGSGRSGRGG